MSVYFIQKFSERIMIQAIMNEGVTIASVVTVMVQRVINMLDHVIFPATFRCMLLGGGPAPSNIQDRKSTRLNSSHVAISYAVFCLKKKKKINRKIMRKVTIGLLTP